MTTRFVYLAGAITHDEDPRAWRRAAALLMPEGWDVFDPLELEAHTTTDRGIVIHDYRWIMQSSAVIVRANVPSWGTAMEIAFATQHGIPVVAWDSPRLDRASPWLRHHVDLFAQTLELAVNYLEHLS